MTFISLPQLIILPDRSCYKSVQDIAEKLLTFARHYGNAVTILLAVDLVYGYFRGRLTAVGVVTSTRNTQSGNRCELAFGKRQVAAADRL